MADCKKFTVLPNSHIIKVSLKGEKVGEDVGNYVLFIFIYLLIWISKPSNNKDQFFSSPPINIYSILETLFTYCS